jgi:thiamine biosynthesis lipoprotein
MGCEMLAMMDGETSQAFPGPQWFEEWEQVASRFRMDSVTLNRTHQQPVQVSQILWDVFQAAREADELTNGLVTPTLLDAIVEAGYDRPFDNLPHLATFSPAPVNSIRVTDSDHR